MHRLLKSTYIFSILFLLILLSTEPACAYLDPATGSYLFQIVIAALLGGVLALKTFGRGLILKIRNLFSKNNDNKKDAC